MSKYAIVQLAGKQFKVTEGDTIAVGAHLEHDNDSLTISDVLLVGDGSKTTVGTPTVAKASVDFQVITEGKSEKISVRTYRNKSRYRRHYGHRQPQTVLKVKKITA